MLCNRAKILHNHIEMLHNHTGMHPKCEKMLNNALKELKNVSEIHRNAFKAAGMLKNASIILMNA